jgi:hypothetical protein
MNRVRKSVRARREIHRILQPAMEWPTTTKGCPLGLCARAAPMTSAASAAGKKSSSLPGGVYLRSRVHDMCRVKAKPPFFSEVTTCFF